MADPVALPRPLRRRPARRAGGRPRRAAAVARSRASRRGSTSRTPLLVRPGQIEAGQVVSATEHGGGAPRGAAQRAGHGDRHGHRPGRPHRGPGAARGRRPPGPGPAGCARDAAGRRPDDDRVVVDIRDGAGSTAWPRHRPDRGPGGPARRPCRRRHRPDPGPAARQHLRGPRGGRTGRRRRGVTRRRRCAPPPQQPTPPSGSPERRAGCRPSAPPAADGGRRCARTPSPASRESGRERRADSSDLRTRNGLRVRVPGSTRTAARSGRRPRRPGAGRPAQRLLAAAVGPPVLQGPVEESAPGRLGNRFSALRSGMQRGSRTRRRTPPRRREPTPVVPRHQRVTGTQTEERS